MATAPHSEAIDHLWAELHKMEPTTQKGGDYANKPGYHNTRAGNDPHNYSVVDAVDKQGPDNLAAAFDWTFPEAQSGHYDLIMKYGARLLASGKDKDDDRLDWMREFYGQADKDTAVEGWDFRYARAASSDPSHLWHIHFSFSRNALTIANMDKLLEVLRGDDDMPTVDEIVNGLLSKKLKVTDEWKAQFPNDPGIQDGEISFETALKSGYFWSRQSEDPEGVGAGQMAEVLAKLAELEAKVDALSAGGGTPLPPAGATVSVTGTFELTPTA